MLIVRNPNKYVRLTGMDNDEHSVEISKKLMDAWSLGAEAPAKTRLRDACAPESVGPTYDVIINCSCEHMNADWYRQVKPHQIICIQTSNRITDDPTWNVTNANPTIDSFKAKFPMSQILFEGERVFDYGHLCYSRYMLIGYK